MKLVTTTVAPAVALAALAPFLMTGQAQAATSSHGCTVDPIRPVASGTFTASNIPEVDYKIRVACNGGRTIQVQSFRMEEDTVAREGEGVDDVTGNKIHNLDFTGGAGAQTVKVRVPLPKTPNDGAVEEVFHKVRFRVTTPAGTSAWTPFEATGVRRIHR